MCLDVLITGLVGEDQSYMTLQAACVLMLVRASVHFSENIMTAIGPLVCLGGQWNRPESD